MLKFSIFPFPANSRLNFMLSANHLLGGFHFYGKRLDIGEGRNIPATSQAWFIKNIRYHFYLV